MLADERYWTLRFDGTGFKLTECAQTAQAAVRHRVLEENLETILFHWGHELLPAPRLQILGWSGALEREPDLLAVDELGRIHIFELKKDRADEDALFQLVSYLTGRPRDDEQWVRRTIAHTLWYGEQVHACRLAALVARQTVEKLRTEKSRKVAGRPVLYIDRLEAKLERLTQLTGDRTRMALTPATFLDNARLLLEQETGGSWQGPLKAPAAVLDEVAHVKLPRHWQIGRTKPGVVIWMIAPDVSAAASAAQPLIDRGLEIRCLSVDVREVTPGIEWNVAVAAPDDQSRNWSMADACAKMLARITDRHLAECPEAASRLYLGLQPASVSWVTGQGWAELGWRAAGGASVIFSVRQERVELSLFNHNWTDGLALAMRQPILRACKRIRQEHPSSWPWSHEEPNADCNLEFIEAAVQLVNAFWRDLEGIGAFDVDRWAYWMPPECSR